MNPNDTAFPVVPRPDNDYCSIEWGMSIRTYAAIQALNGILANKLIVPNAGVGHEKMAIKMADKLLAELEKSDDN